MITIYFLIVVIIVIITIFLFEEKIRIMLLKRMIRRKGLYNFLLFIEKNIIKESWQLHWDAYQKKHSKKVFVDDMTLIFSELSTFLHSDLVLSEVQFWTLKQCVHFLELQKRGLRQSYGDEYIIILSHPVLLDVLLPVAIRAEERLLFLLNERYQNSLSSGDVHEIVYANFLHLFLSKHIDLPSELEDGIFAYPVVRDAYLYTKTTINHEDIVLMYFKFFDEEEYKKDIK